MQEPIQVGWIGTGVMGNPMCNHIIQAGHQVFVYNRTRSKTDNLIAKGAKWCGSARDVAANSNIIFTMVGYPHDVQTIILEKNGVLSGASKETVIVDMTTSSPDLARLIYAEAKSKGVYALDAPVSGGDIGAKEARLAIMVGGDADVFQCALALLNIFGENIAHMGPPGAGQHTKMCNQILVAGNMIGAVESLLYAHRTGIALEKVIDVIGKGAASSWIINNIGPRIANNDFSPGFFVKHFVKDMGIALKEAERMKLSLPGLSLVHQFYTAAMAQGDEDLGTQALYRVLARLNDLRI